MVAISFRYLLAKGSETTFFLRLLFYLKQRETKENLVSSLLNFFLLSVFPEKSPDYHFPEVAASQVNLLYVHFAS